MRVRRVGSIIAVALVTPLFVAGTAEAAGGPILPGEAYGPHGATAPGSPARYVTLFAGRETVVARIRQDGGQVQDTRSFGGYAIPSVTIDGDAGGLSADGSTLVLAQTGSALRRAMTRFRLLDAELRVRDRITLRGSFTFDAISPDGSRIFLIEYLSRNDPTRYEVRAYDTRSKRLLPEPIVDPEEPPGEMRGYPVSRTTSPEGRWAYTLYDGGEHPFIHALDTVDARAVCIDLHEVKPSTVYRSKLTVGADGSDLTVTDRKHGPLAVVDTASFEVSSPSPPAGRGFPWLEVVLVPVAATAGWALVRGLRRRRLAPGGAR
jgi:hypothetical protein